MVEGAINLIADMPRHEVIEGGQTTDTQVLFFFFFLLKITFLFYLENFFSETKIF